MHCKKLLAIIGELILQLECLQFVLTIYWYPFPSWIGALTIEIALANVNQQKPEKCDRCTWSFGEWPDYPMATLTRSSFWRKKKDQEPFWLFGRFAHCLV